MRNRRRILIVLAAGLLAVDGFWLWRIAHPPLLVARVEVGIGEMMPYYPGPIPDLPHFLSEQRVWLIGHKAVRQLSNHIIHEPGSIDARDHYLAIHLGKDATYGEFLAALLDLARQNICIFGVQERRDPGINLLEIMDVAPSRSSTRKSCREDPSLAAPPPLPFVSQGAKGAGHDRE